MMLTAIVSHMNIRVYKNTQTQALLEKRVRELEKKLEEYEDKE
jgi:DNA-directed RNA polymerase subunit L